MPYTTNAGVQIYYESQGSGPPLVLHHGSFGSLEDWRELGYTEALSRHRQIVLLDSRGHGRSDKPHDSASYALTSRTGDVIAVLDALGIPKADFMGYSMGGWIGFALARSNPDRFRSLILGGGHPFEENMSAFRALLPTEIEPFLALLEPVFGPYLTPAMRTRLAANDLAALAALTLDREAFPDVLPTMQMPCLLFAGTADPRLRLVERCAEQMPHATFFPLPDCGHVAALGRADLVMPHVVAFLDRR